jgi:hypothetical protein
MGVRVGGAHWRWRPIEAERDARPATLSTGPPAAINGTPAGMLGSTRPTVNVVASTLQKAGRIRYKHGRITILDREGLEAGSCECYGSVPAQFDRLGV